MVGVPGKSKGCSTCRRRKKGCDQARPTCGNCKQSGYECGGYKRELTFVHHPASKAVESATFAPLARTKNQALKIVPFYVWQPAIEMQFRSLFLDLYMPRGDCEVRDRYILACKHPMNWTVVVPELSGTEPSLERAFSALSIARVGRDNEDDRLIRESRKLYGKALNDLNKALSDLKRRYSDEVLTASMVLSLYEVFEGSAKKDIGWVSHTQGAANLVQMRGAHRHATRQAHHVFLGSRLPTLYAAILQRKTTFLASSEWLTLPWALENKTFHDRLIDLMTRIPTLLEQTDIAMDIPDPEIAIREQLRMLEACQQIEKALHGWRVGMKKTAGETATEHKDEDGNDYPFRYDFTYENHLFARTQAVYWSCHLLVSDTMYDLQVSLERLTVGSNEQPFPSDTLRSNSRTYAVNIAQAIDYFLLPEMGALGPDLISFPMGLAYRFFSQSQEHEVCAWFVNSLENMKKRGFHIGRFLRAFSAAESSRRRHGSSESSDAHSASPTSTESYSSGATLVQVELLQPTLRALLTSQEQWRLASMVEESAHEAQWFLNHHWWAFWDTEPPMPPVVVVKLGGELEQQPEEEQQEERPGWTISNGGLSTSVQVRNPDRQPYASEGPEPPRLHLRGPVVVIKVTVYLLYSSCTIPQQHASFKTSPHHICRCWCLGSEVADDHRA